MTRKISRLRLRCAVVNGQAVIQTRRRMTRTDADWIKAHAEEILEVIA